MPVVKKELSAFKSMRLATLTRYRIFDLPASRQILWFFSHLDNLLVTVIKTKPMSDLWANSLGDSLSHLFN